MQRVGEIPIRFIFMALKETPKITQPEFVMVLKSDIEAMKANAEVAKAEMDRIQKVFKDLVDTTETIVRPDGTFLDFRTDSTQIATIMQGVGTILKHQRYKSIVEDLIKIAEGKK